MHELHSQVIIVANLFIAQEQVRLIGLFLVWENSFEQFSVSSRLHCHTTNFFTGKFAVGFLFLRVMNR